MTTKKEIKEYFENYFDYPDIILGNNVDALTFSYLLGMSPSECVEMYPESDWSQEQEDEWEEIHNIIYKLKKELKEKLNKRK